MNQNRIAVIVREILQETDDIKSFYLESPDGAPLPAAQAGDHIDVVLPDQSVRQYSLCNGPLETSQYHISIKKEEHSRGGSRQLHENVKVGDHLLISMPRSNFPLASSSAPSLLVAGGIGITPVLSMLKHLQHAGLPYELHYFTRSENDIPFAPFLKSMPGVTLHTGLDASRTQEQLIKLLANRKRGAQLYFCGPRPFMSAIRTIAPSLNWPEDAIHFEYFSPESEPAGNASDKPFEVVLAQSGHTIEVPAGQTILQALRNNGIQTESSCERGTCGACVVKVLEGVPDHRDSFLSDFQKKAGKKIALCVSRSCTPKIVIDK